MSTVNKPVIGYRECPDCGERQSIHLAGGKRHQLYGRCECGCVQSNGKVVQSRLWYETDWIEGMKPEMPPAVMPRHDYEAALVKVAERNGAKSIGQTDRPGDLPGDGDADLGDDFVPGGPGDDKPIDQPGKKGGLLMLVVVGIGLLAAGMRA